LRVISVAQAARRNELNVIQIFNWLAEEAIVGIGVHCAIEKEARGSPPKERAALQMAKAKPIFDNFQKLLDAQIIKISGKSPLPQAIRYALTWMGRLKPDLAHGILELDNNTAGRAMRPIALVWKNYLFVGSLVGGPLPQKFRP
jgi:transposase